MIPAQHQPKGLIGVFAQHPVAANLLMLLMIFTGLWALARMNTQFFPDYDLDFISVTVVRPGATSEDIQTSITIPIEQELKTVDRVKKMRSTSRLGVSSILLEFEEHTDMGVALDQVKEKIDLVRNLPQDAEKPEVIRIIEYEPVAKLLVSGASLRELRTLVREFERELLDKGIAKIEFDGLPEEEMAIEIKSTTLDELGLTLNDVANRISSMSQDIPAGTVGKDETSRQLRAVEQARNEQNFRALPVIADNQGRLIRLGDIAEVTRRPKELETIVSYRGEPAIELSLLRTGDADSLESAQIIQSWFADRKDTLPPNIKLKVYEENWQLIVQRINLLLKNGAGGLILIIIILFLFLNERVAFWVAVGIPVSFMAALGALFLFGESINMLSLFALIMTLGIIVDDAIVVGEDALTHFQKGENELQAAEGGARRMLAPVMSSSLTTVSAFLPLMLVSGVIGQFLFTIPLVVICVILASLVESFLVLPGHLNHSFHKLHGKEPSKLRIKLDNHFNNFKQNKFRPLVTVAITHRWAVIAFSIATLVLAFSLVASNRLKFNFFPSPEGNVIYANIQFTSGTPPSTVEGFLRHLETTLEATDNALKADESLLVSYVTRENSTFNYEQVGPERGEQYGSIYVELISSDSRDIRNKQFIEAWRKRVAIPAGLEQFTISEAIAGPPGKDIDIEMTGPSSTTILKRAAVAVAEKVKTFPGVSNVQDDLPFGQQQLIFSLTSEGKSLGLTVQEISRQVQSAFNSQLVQIFNEGDEEIEVRVMLADSERKQLTSLNRFPIVTNDGATIPLASVVSFTHQRGIDVLRHNEGRLTVNVTGEVDSDVANANLIIADLQKNFLPQISEQYGVTVDFKGRAEDQQATLSDMKQGALYALILIYIILAWVFGSYVWPFAVIAAIPFGLTGAIFGHYLMGIDMTILSLFGIFGLSGIVINDSIVLITFYKHMRAAGMKTQEAIIEASCQRLRAVLLTSMTTIAGLIPLLSETSLQAQFLIPMATSISFGLAFGTFLVLLFVPAALSIIETTMHGIKNMRKAH